MNTVSYVLPAIFAQISGIDNNQGTDVGITDLLAILNYGHACAVRHRNIRLQIGPRVMKVNLALYVEFSIRHLKCKVIKLNDKMAWILYKFAALGFL